MLNSISSSPSIRNIMAKCIAGERAAYKNMLDEAEANLKQAFDFIDAALINEK